MPRRAGPADLFADLAAVLQDLIVAKILAGRPKDLDDVTGVLARQKSHLNFKLIHKTLKALESALARNDLRPALERLLREGSG